MNVRSKLILTILLSLTLVGNIPLSQPVLAEEASIQTYDRKYISFYPQNEMGKLNQTLYDYFSNHLRRFDYHNLNSKIPIEKLSGFFDDVRKNQMQNAGELAANAIRNEKKDLKFGDVVVTWSETNKIANSAFVYATHWHFSPIELGNIRLEKEFRDKKGGYPKASYPPGTYTEVETNPLNQTYKKYWKGSIGSSLVLTIDIYKVKQEGITKYRTLKESWNFGEDYYLTGGDVSAIKSQFKQRKLDTPSYSQVEYLYSLPKFNRYKAIDPKKEYLFSAENLLASEAPWKELQNQIKSLEEFNIKTQLGSENAWGNIEVVLPNGENSKNLDLKLDQGFKVYENIVNQEGVISKKKEIGYIKLRDLTPKTYGQIIIENRKLELGDQLIEYPQKGYSLKYSTGAYSATFNDGVTSIMPNLGVSADLSLANATGVSELFAGFNATAGYNPLDYALILEGGIGAYKRFYLKQFALSIGVDIAMQMAGKSDRSREFYIDQSIGYGLIPNLGLHYLISPEQIIGINLGYRFFNNEKTNGLNFHLFSSREF